VGAPIHGFTGDRRAYVSVESRKSRSPVGAYSAAEHSPRVVVLIVFGSDARAGRGTPWCESEDVVRPCEREENWSLPT
jgi:hypothetical protein